MKRKKRLPKLTDSDAAVRVLMAGGLTGLVGGTYWLATNEQAEPEPSPAPYDDWLLPPLNELLPPDAAVPQLGPQHPSGLLSAGNDAPDLGAGQGKVVAAAVPQVAWQAATPTIELPAIKPPPEPPIMPMQAVEPPPPAAVMDEADTEDDDTETMDMASAGVMPSALASGMPNDNMMGAAAPNDAGQMGQAAPTSQEVAQWDELFGTPVIPQSRILDLDSVILIRGVTEERALAQISFGDPVLDAAGVTMAPHPALEIRNGNELWLVGGVDITDPYFVPQLYVRLYSLADPSSFAGFVLYVQDEPLPWQDPDYGNDQQYQDTGSDGSENQEQPLLFDSVFLTRGITEERALAQISFGDPILDAAGARIDPHPALEIRNGNELWLRGGVDITDPYFLPQLYVPIYSVADPNISAGLVLYISEASPDNGNNQGNDYQQGEYQQAPNQQEANAFGEEADGFGEMMYEYHQSPDII